MSQVTKPEKSKPTAQARIYVESLELCKELARKLETTQVEVIRVALIDYDRRAKEAGLIT